MISTSREWLHRVDTGPSPRRIPEIHVSREQDGEVVVTVGKPEVRERERAVERDAIRQARAAG